MPTIMGVVKTYVNSQKMNRIEMREISFDHLEIITQGSLGLKVISPRDLKAW